MNTQELKLEIFKAAMSSNMDPSQRMPFLEWGLKQFAKPDEENLKPIIINPCPELDGLKLGELIERIRTDPNSPTIIQRYDAPDTPSVTHQTPEEVLRANGWELSDEREIYRNEAHPKIKLWLSPSGVSVIGFDGLPSSRVFDCTKSTFEDWLTSQVEALTDKSEAGKVEVVIEKAEYKMGVDGNGIEYAEMFMLGKTETGGTYSYAHRAEGGDCFDFRSTIYTTFARPIHVGTKILVNHSPAGRITLPLEFV